MITISSFMDFSDIYSLIITASKFIGFPVQTMDQASKNGDIRILEWWVKYHQNNNTQPEYTSDAMDMASTNGHIDVLEWWMNFHSHQGNNIQSKYTVWAMDGASTHGHIDVLKWWMDYHEKNDTHPKYTTRAIDWASHNGHVDVLELWMKYHIRSGAKVPLLYTKDAIDCIFHCPYQHENDRSRVLRLWIRMHHQHGIELKYSSRTICDKNDCDCNKNRELMNKCINSLKFWTPWNHHCFDKSTKKAIMTMVMITTLDFYLPKELRFEIFKWL